MKRFMDVLTGMAIIMIIGGIIGMFVRSLPAVRQEKPTQARQTAVRVPVTPASTLGGLMDAIEYKESKYDSQAVGDSGNAIGAYQIWKIMVDDVNRILKDDCYAYQDRYDRNKSRRMCETFLSHYCKDMSAFDKARCWNGGPKGYLKDSTLDYAHDVMRIMWEQAK